MNLHLIREIFSWSILAIAVAVALLLEWAVRLGLDLYEKKNGRR